MWARKKQQTALVDTPDLDELIQSLRGVVATNARADVVGQLISLLTIRGTLEVQTERPERALEDRRAAAGLLRGFDGQPSPADRHTDLLARMALVAAERAAGNLDEAMDAAVWAIDHIGPVRTEDTDVCEAFVADLDRLRGDLNAAKRRPEALKAAELASDLATRLAELDESAYMALLGSSWVNEAGARANAGDHDGAQALNNEAIALLEEYAPTWPALTTALTNRAHLQRRSGEWEDAITTEKQLLDGVRADQPSSREEIERLKSLFLTLVRSGRNEEAEQTISEAIAVSRRLALQDPAQSLTLSVLLGNQASVRGELGRYQDALTSSEEALSLREQLVLAEPSPAADEGLAMTLNNHSAVLRRLGRNADAAAASSRSVELRRRNVDHENPNSVALLANSLNSHAEHLALLGDAERALAEALEARDLFAGLPAPGANTSYLRANQDTLGTVLAMSGRYDEAVEAAEQAVELGRAAAAETPGDIPELASCLEALAARLDQVGRTSDAEASRAEATQLRASPAS